MFPSVTQPSLFAPSGDNSDLWSTLRLAWQNNRVRVALQRSAYLDVIPDFVPNADALLSKMLSCVPWESERREMYGRLVDVPRLQAFYDSEQRWPSPGLLIMRDVLSQCYRDEYAQPFTTLGACLYRGPQDSVAWHADDTGPAKHTDTAIAVVSLGAARPFVIKPTTGGETRRFIPAHGDLLVMGGSFQRTWLHCVPKLGRACSARVSLQFRMPAVR